MKKVIYPLIVLLVVVSALFANREIKHEAAAKNKAAEKPAPVPLTEAQKRAERAKWEATPEGIKYKQWEASPEGKKVYAGAAKIRKYKADSANIEAVVTALSLPPGSRLGFGVMVSIDGDEYILRFDGEPQQLSSLKVNDKIIIRSHGVSYAPKYAYPIISGEYAERDGKIMYKHPPRKGGC